MIPDISRLAITMELEMKYDASENAHIRKHSITALTRRNGIYLKVILFARAITMPTVSETMPKIRNFPRIMKIVYHWKSTVCKDTTVLNKIIDTISLTHPSPKQQLYSLGCFV